jgi:hypothetical protein
MKSKNIVIVAVILILLVGGIYWIFKTKNKPLLQAPIPTPNIVSKINENFPNLDVPSGSEQAELKPTKGQTGMGVAIRQKKDNFFSLTVMANLPALQKGNYTAGISDGKNVVNLGPMKFTKTGFLVDFGSIKDLSSYNLVTVANNGNNVLEGSFQKSVN